MTRGPRTKERQRPFYPRWTPEADERLKALLAENLSASQISARFGNCSRNAVIGRVHRLNLSFSKAAPAAVKANRARSNAKKAVGNTPAVPTRKKLIAGIEHVALRPEKQKAKPAPIVLPSPSPSVPAVVPTFTTRESRFLPLPDSPPVNLADMEGGKCHWPVNGLYGKEPAYCGRPADGAYCREHHSIAYTPAPPPKETRHGARS